MKKAVLIIIIVIVVLAGLFGGYYLFTQSQKTSSPLPADNQKMDEKKLPSKSLKDYEDEAGFTISYPDDLTLVKNEVDDASVYTDLSFTAKEVKGSINILIKDTKVKTVDAYIKETLTESTDIKDASLGALSAREARDGDTITLVAFDQGVLFSIQVLSESEVTYWADAYEQIVKSFAFVQVAQTTSGSSSQSSSGGSSDVIFEGEEVVE